MFITAHRVPALVGTLRDKSALYGGSQGIFLLRAWQPAAAMPAAEKPASVTATFASSFEKIESISPAAVELLRFCAFLHPDAIPEELIIS